MRRRFVIFGVVFGLILATVSGTYAAEMPSVDDLQAQMETPAGTVTVYEPHLSVGNAHVAVDYVGYPAVDVMARLFGADWSSQAETVEFRALDGYVSRIAVERFLTEGAYIVFMRGDGSPFTVDNLAQNQTGVPLGPYYLVWDNIGDPALLAEGAGNMDLSGGRGESGHALRRRAITAGSRHPLSRRRSARQDPLPELPHGERLTAARNPRGIWRKSPKTTRSSGSSAWC